MARVPTATPGAVSPGGLATPFQNTRGADVSAFGGLEAAATQNLGSAVAQVSDVAANIAITKQKEDNERRARQLDTQFANMIRGITVGSEGSPGLYSLKGQQALDARGGAMDSIAKGQSSILEGISNPAVKLAFEASSDARVLREFGAIERHSGNARLVANKASSVARQAEALDYAMLHFTNNEALLNSIGIAREEAITQAEAAGFDPAAQASAAQEAQTVVISGAIEAAIKGSLSARAQEILDKFTAAGMIDGRVLPGLQNMLKSHTDIEGAQVNAEEAIAAHPDDPAAALAFLRTNLSGKEEADAVSEAKVRFAEAGAVAKARARQIEGNAAGAMHNGTSFKDWSSQNPREAAQLQRNTEAYNRVRQAEQLNAKGQTFAPVSDNISLTHLSRLPTKELIETDPEMVKAFLTEEEFGQFISKQTAAKSAAEKLETNPTLFNGPVTVLRSMFSDSINEDDKRLLVQEMREFVATTIETTGKPPKQQDVFHEAQRLLLNVRGDLKTGFFGVGRGGFSILAAEADTLTPEQRAVARVDLEDIPGGIMSSILAAFAVRNTEAKNKGQLEVDLTDDLIEDIAGAIALGDNERIEALLDEVE